MNRPRRRVIIACAAAVGTLLLAVLFFVRVPYRIEGNFVLKSDEVQFRTAPFEGYIEQVFVRPGDAVKSGDKLLKLKVNFGAEERQVLSGVAARGHNSGCAQGCGSNY